MAKSRCPKCGNEIPSWAAVCPRCAQEQDDIGRYDNSLGFRKKPTSTFTSTRTINWRDKKGVSHGDRCRVEFRETVCRYCQREVYYFECTHGSKVFFHDVPWWGGSWDTECPAN